MLRDEQNSGHVILCHLMFQSAIDPSEVDKRLSSIKIHKSPGPDGIPNWLLRDFSSFLCQPLAAIFNSSIREGFVPPIWKSTEVVPVPKIHPPTSIQNDAIQS